MIEYHFLSLGYRFGVAKLSDRYIAFYGQPNRNEDYYIIVEISGDEYRSIIDKYPAQVLNKCADAATFADFVSRYIENRDVLYQGWSLPDDEDWGRS